MGAVKIEPVWPSCDEGVDWYGCYSEDSKWKHLQNGESFAHPAKMAWGLGFRIIRHLKHLGLLTDGAPVLDFFGGTGRTAAIALYEGHPAVTVELEPRFVGFQWDNDKHIREVLVNRPLPAWEILEGDARGLSGLLEGQMAGVVSPPYSHDPTRKGHGIDMEKVATHGQNSVVVHTDGYGSTPGQIGALKLAGVVSPPYGWNAENGGLNTKPPRPGTNDQAGRSAASPSQTGEGYGYTPGQIGKLAAVTSPPFLSVQEGGGIIKEGYQPQSESGKGRWKGKEPDWVGDRTYRKEMHGDDSKNIGNIEGESYETACLQVYREAAKVCNVLAIVTKDPTKKGKLVPLAATTARLLEEAGFEIVDYHRAHLWSWRHQQTLTGDTISSPKGRVSFFKRLSIAKGSPAAQWEDILIAQRRKEPKPLTEW